MKDLLNLNAMAKKLGVSLEMVRRMAAAGETPHLRVGKRVLFSEDAVEEWVLSRMRSSCRDRRGVLGWKLIKTDEVSLPFQASPEERKSWAEHGLVLCVLTDSPFTRDPPGDDEDRVNATAPSKAATQQEAPEDLERGLQPVQVPLTNPSDPLKG